MSKSDKRFQSLADFSRSQDERAENKYVGEKGEEVQPNPITA